MVTENGNLFQVFNGQVVIIRSLGGSGIQALVDKVTDITTNDEMRKGPDIYLFLDLSNFSAVSSFFFGTLGAAIQLPYVKLVVLCGMKETVRKIAKRFGIVDGNLERAGVSKEISDHVEKFRIYDSLEKAVPALVNININ